RTDPVAEDPGRDAVRPQRGRHQPSPRRTHRPRGHRPRRRRAGRGPGHAGEMTRHDLLVRRARLAWLPGAPVGDVAAAGGVVTEIGPEVGGDAAEVIDGT